jgi:hypothetical protein
MGSFVNNPVDALASQVSSVQSTTASYLAQANIAMFQSVLVAEQELFEFSNAQFSLSQAIDSASNELLWERGSSNNLSIVIMGIGMMIVIVYLIFS